MQETYISSFESLPRRHRVTAELPHGMATIVRQAVYEQSRGQDPEAVLDEMTQIKDAAKAPYLAWETVRKGGRAAELVGDIVQVNPVTHEKLSLPHTGFEGYFAGIIKANPTPKELLALEAQLGLVPLPSSLQKRLDELDSLTPEQVVIQDIARIGELQVQHVHALTARMSHPADAQKAFTDMLMGTRFDAQYGALAMKDLSGSFGALLGRMRALGRVNKTVNENTETFRGKTYEQLVRPLTLQYYPTNEGHLTQEYAIPLSLPSARPPTHVTLSKPELQGYRFMENIGRFGNPLIRKSLPHMVKR